MMHAHPPRQLPHLRVSHPLRLELFRAKLPVENARRHVVRRVEVQRHRVRVLVRHQRARHLVHFHCRDGRVNVDLEYVVGVYFLVSHYLKNAVHRRADIRASRIQLYGHGVREPA